MVSFVSSTLQIATAQILINGIRVPEIEQDLLRVKVTTDLEAISMFALHLENQDLQTGDISWSDDRRLNLGNLIEIWLSNDQQFGSVISGEITGLEPEFSQDEGSVLIVRGHDLRHRLLRGRKTRSFTKMKDSAIAQAIASQAGLVPKIEDTQVTLDYVLQNNQTDLAFLQARANRIGYEVWVENKNFYFQPHQHTTRKIVTLSLKKNLIEFSPRLSSLSQISQVEIRGWDVQKKEAITSKASRTEAMGRISGSQAASQAFGGANHVVVNQPISSKAEGDRIADGQFTDASLAYIVAEGTCRGQPNLRVGTVVEIAGAGQRFSGSYYLVSVTHLFSKEGSYLTEFTVRRNAT